MMIVGIPSEIKDREFRVGMVPAGVKAMTAAGHPVLVQTGAGLGSGIDDAQYRAAGAELVATAAEIWERAGMIVKVKEPLASEYPLLRAEQILFTYLHLAPLPELTDILLARQVTGIGYETVRLDNGSLPLLAPMSEVAGKMAIQVGARLLEKEAGGRGILLGGVPGVAPAHVTIIGSGVVGSASARIAAAMGAEVTVLGRNRQQLIALDNQYQGRVSTLFSNQENIAAELRRADLVVGAVLVPGRCAPKLITREMISHMQKGSVLVDVAIDQGGCAETSRPTTHSHPVYIVDGVTHYCVTNMPGAVSRTSTFALTGVTLPYALALAEKNVATAAAEDPALKCGINTYQGKLLNREVAVSQNREWTEVHNA